MYPSHFAPRHDPASSAAAAFTASQAHEARGEDAVSSTAHANIRGEGDSASSRHWAQVDRLLTQMQRTMRQGADFVLVGDELEQVQRALTQADSTMLPPDRRDSLHPWTETLNRALLGTRHRGVQELRVKHADLEELAGLLQETLVTSSKLEYEQWVPLDDGDRLLLRELANWMKSGSVAQLPQRCEVGRQVLLQSRGLISDIHFGSDTETPELPSMDLLHELMDPRTRAHVSLGGGIDKTLNLDYPLAALPLRTWRLGDARTLEWVVDQQPAHLRTLDLRPWKGSLVEDVEVSDLLRRASDELPNLAEILLPELPIAGALSDPWTAHNANGWQYIRHDRPDGLALLDEAVAAWEGMVVGTRMGIRRKASREEGAALLELTRSVAPFRFKWVEAALLQILQGAAQSDELMRRYADAYRSACERTRDPQEQLRMTRNALNALNAAGAAPRWQPAKSSQAPTANAASARTPTLLDKTLDTTSGTRFLAMPLALQPRVPTSNTSSRSSPLSPSSPLGPFSPTEREPGLQASRSSGRSGSVMSLASLFEQRGSRAAAHRSVTHADDSSDATEPRSAGFESDTEPSFSDWETGSTASIRSATSFAWKAGPKGAVGLPTHLRADTAPALLSRMATPGPKPQALPASEPREVAPPPQHFLPQEPAKVVILQRGQALSAQLHDEPTAPGLAHASGATPSPAKPFLSTFSVPKRPAPAVPERPPVGGARPAAERARSVPLQQAATQPAALREADESFDFGTMKEIIGRELHFRSEAP